jgi:hypothetical protein
MLNPEGMTSKGRIDEHEQFTSVYYKHDHSKVTTQFMSGAIIARIIDKITRITVSTPIFGVKTEKYRLSHHLFYLYFTVTIYK